MSVTNRIGTVDMVMRAPAKDDAPGTLYAANLTREGTVERVILRTLCASITAAGSGTVSWRRAGASEGSGREREAGQFDSRSITKAWLNDNGNGILYLFVFLNASAGKGEGMRRIRIDSLRCLTVGV